MFVDVEALFLCRVLSAFVSFVWPGQRGPFLGARPQGSALRPPGAAFGAFPPSREGARDGGSRPTVVFFVVS